MCLNGSVSLTCVFESTVSPVHTLLRRAGGHTTSGLFLFECVNESASTGCVCLNGSVSPANANLHAYEISPSHSLRSFLSPPHSNAHSAFLQRWDAWGKRRRRLARLAGCAAARRLMVRIFVGMCDGHNDLAVKVQRLAGCAAARWLMVSVRGCLQCCSMLRGLPLMHQSNMFVFLFL